MISGVSGIAVGGRSRAGGHPGEGVSGTGSLKTRRAAAFWGTGWLLKTRGDRIFSVGGADLWFAPGCGTRTPLWRPGLRFWSSWVARAQPRARGPRLERRPARSSVRGGRVWIVGPLGAPRPGAAFGAQAPWAPRARGPLLGVDLSG